MGLITLLTDPGSFEFYTTKQKGYVNPNNLNPREIPFGKDRTNGGSSKQPYVVKKPTPLNKDNKDSSFYSDFILRGGILAPIAAGEDVSRLTQYFSDLDNPIGASFALKQNSLSKIGVKTEATKGAAYLGSARNEGVYNPLSTLTEAGIGFLGGHVNKQGLGIPGAGVNIKSYQDVIYNNQLNPNTPFKVEDNRLTYLQKLILSPTPNTSQSSFKDVNKYRLYPDLSTLINYSGGPDSVLGIGNTSINFATTNNANTPLKTIQNLSTSENNNPSLTSIFKTWGLSTLLTPPSEKDSVSLIREDFRKILEPTGQYQNRFLSTSPNYKKKNIENNIGLGNPGNKNKDRSNYNAPQPALDKVNASYIYKSTNSDYGLPEHENLNDIIPFYIGILNNELQPGGPFKKYIHFRAFIDSFSDNYNADWNAINYMGRAEKFYKYKGFDRTINMSFTVVAQSRPEITAMYDKLNFLASSLAPEYLDATHNGYMAGNIAYLTLGGYVHEQPGIITQLTYDVPEESPWEIGIDVNGNPADPKSVRQLPHIIKVTSFQFTPIHTFRPEKQSFSEDPPGTTSTRLTKPGNQRYIDQQRPETTDYDGEGNNLAANTNAGSNDISITTFSQDNQLIDS
jgi:hypothetical protein